VFAVEEIQQKLALLSAPEFVLVDRQSRHEFGPAEGKRFGDADIGGTAETGERRVRIKEHYSLGGGFAADGGVLLNERGFCRIYPGRSPEVVSLGLIRLKPGADPEAVARQIRQALPEDVEVLTRRRAVAKELNRWVNETSVGVIFRLGVAVALVVGTAIVYQVLSSDVANHLAEYATLKAMGYTPRFVAGVVLRQAVALAVLGFLPGLLLAEFLYRVTAQMANIPIGMTAGRIVAVLGLTVAMCTISGLGAVRKLRSAEPADLF
jgi:putative ABC transport system permease protein